MFKAIIIGGLVGAFVSMIGFSPSTNPIQFFAICIPLNIIATMLLNFLDGN